MQAVYDLENRGLPFSRTDDGRIAQRRFGGHTRNFGEAAVRRSCYAADRTGHMILQTLYQQCIKNQVSFYDEFQAIDIIMDGTRVAGIVALELATGEIHVFRAKAVLFATGGFGRMFKITSNAYANTGDGPALLARAMISWLPLISTSLRAFNSCTHLGRTLPRSSNDPLVNRCSPRVAATTKRVGSGQGDNSAMISSTKRQSSFAWLRSG